MSPVTIPVKPDPEVAMALIEESDDDLFLDEEEQIKREMEDRRRRIEEITLKHKAQSLAAL